MNRIEELIYKLEIELLKAQVQCLSSVLSEWNEDKSHFVQYNRAKELQPLIDELERYL